MTELEKMIYECAKEVLKTDPKKIMADDSPARFIRIPFFCDGVFDIACFDKQLGKFIYLEYASIKENPKNEVIGAEMTDHGAYADMADIEFKRIYLTDE